MGDYPGRLAGMGRFEKGWGLGEALRNERVWEWGLTERKGR